MSLIARVSSNLSSSSSESPGKRGYGNQDPWSAKPERERIERSNPLWAATQKPCQTIITNNLLKALSQHATQSGMTTKLGLLKSGKLGDRTGQPVVTSWGKTHESQSRIFHDKTQHVIVDEEEPHDRTVQPVVYPQKRSKATAIYHRKR